MISKVAEAQSARIKRLVFWNAFVVANGNNVYDELPPPVRDAIEKGAAGRGDGGCVLPFTAWREVFIQDAPLEVAQRAFAHLRPHPVRVLTDKLDLTTFYTLDIPRSFINCTDDMTLTQLPESGWHPRMSRRLGLFRLVQMPGSHEVMLSRIPSDSQTRSIAPAGTEPTPTQTFRPAHRATPRCTTLCRATYPSKRSTNHRRGSRCRRRQELPYYCAYGPVDRSESPRTSWGGPG